ncbi:ABC transporter ATP-binding protein [Thiorhodospira sibirica]|uniref:ABC transporter ATP-binding protein n=1 Tax=Thiorhodospira sibirica TaxID=154347 RepID=UPI00022C2870|nr:ABC transporter ATP-binding protein [Thiorhodospira sibirica]
MIRVHQLSKRFRLYRTPADRLKEIILRRPYHLEHQALEDVSFTVAEGQTVGIIGQNGAGKSTLLKILSGVLLPDQGYVELSGRVTGLLELGTGFNQEMTGLDNITANAMLLGMDRASIEARREAIVQFAELGEFIAEPLKTYSSGMVMRLAFAIAIHADPSCFVVDEALSVGDAYFQQKCMRAISQFRDQGGSILFVSHDMSAVRSLCDHAILLEAGRVLAQGTPKQIVDQYQAMILHKSHVGDTPLSVNAPQIQSGDSPLLGTGEVRLCGLQLYDAQQQPITQLQSEQPVWIEARLQALRDLDSPHYGMGIRNRFGHSVFETNTYCMGQSPAPLPKGQTVCIRWRVNANLVAGDYSITVGVGNRPYGTGSFEEILFFSHDLAMLTIYKNPDAIHYDGYFNMHPEVCIEPA